MYPVSVTNEKGIYAVRFYIRGKPWIVTVDDYFYFKNGKELFASPQSQGSMWISILEKAWAKVKGSYIDA
jgi:hypothetical protein